MVKNAKPQGARSKPSALQLAFQSASARCFYCRSLLLITDMNAMHSVCSENCPSRIVQMDERQMHIVRRAWLWKKKKCGTVVPTVISEAMETVEASVTQ